MKTRNDYQDNQKANLTINHTVPRNNVIASSYFIQVIIAGYLRLREEKIIPDSVISEGRLFPSPFFRYHLLIKLLSKFLCDFYLY